mmetsp:Transcript_39922/g.102986  ORF Transcript_39922/g.102986 Transcript_39922/m.102986 type:complete len:204 (-) Transcript_39922:906-1517(-)
MDSLQCLGLCNICKPPTRMERRLSHPDMLSGSTCEPPKWGACECNRVSPPTGSSFPSPSETRGGTVPLPGGTSLFESACAFSSITAASNNRKTSPRTEERRGNDSGNFMLANRFFGWEGPKGTSDRQIFGVPLSMHGRLYKCHFRAAPLGTVLFPVPIFLLSFIRRLSGVLLSLFFGAVGRFSSGWGQGRTADCGGGYRKRCP